VICAGQVAQINPNSGKWVFVDIGFAEDKKSCGLLIHDGNPVEVRFSELVAELQKLIRTSDVPINLLLEAPLSVAFTKQGNPTGRSIEKREGKSPRYWYLGLGCGVLTAAAYALAAVKETSPCCEIRLFEGFASFKSKTEKSSHSKDVIALRNVVWSQDMHKQCIVSPTGLTNRDSDVIKSAFAVYGMDFGIPPVVALQS
jgi:hypothetical protein